MASFPLFHRPFLSFPFTHVPPSSFFLFTLSLSLPFIFSPSFFIDSDTRERLNYLNWHLSMVSPSLSPPPSLPSRCINYRAGINLAARSNGVRRESIRPLYIFSRDRKWATTHISAICTSGVLSFRADSGSFFFNSISVGRIIAAKGE